MKKTYIGTINRMVELLKIERGFTSDTPVTWGDLEEVAKGIDQQLMTLGEALYRSDRPWASLHDTEEEHRENSS